MYFIIGLVIATITTYIGWVGVQHTGNYENKWGALMLWSVPIYLLLAVIGVVILAVL